MARPGGAGVQCLGTGTPAFAFSKGACPAPFPLCPRGVFFIEVPSYPLWPTPRPCLCVQSGQDSKSGLLGLSPKSEIPKAWSLGAKNSTSPRIPYSPPLNLHHPALSVCNVFRPLGPSASGHCIERAEGGMATGALRETGLGASRLSLPRN